MSRANQLLSRISDNNPVAILRVGVIEYYWGLYHGSGDYIFPTISGYLRIRILSL